VSDRFDRRHVAIVASFGEFVGALALMVYALSDPTSTLPLFAVAFWFGVSRAFQAPAIRAMPPMVAPEGGLPRTIALSNATWTAAVIIGPVTAGLLITIDPWVAYAAASVLVLIGWLGLFRIRFVRRPEPPDPDERPSLRSAVEGLRFIRRTPVLLAAISLDLFAVLLGGAMALLPVIAEEQLGVGQVGYGWLRAAPGIGAALMAVWLATRPVQRRVGPTLLWTVAVFGLGTVTLGLTASFAIAFISLLVIHAADMVSVLIRGSLVPLLTPDEKRGRVLAVENVFIGASNELGAFRSGVLAQAVGAQATVVGGGLATLIVVALWSVLFPSLRRVDRFDDLEPGGGAEAPGQSTPG
jgi:MFS family permease